MDDLARRLLDALDRRRWTLACAESCTGGRFGAAVTRIPGASEAFRGGLITYVDDIKANVLGVDHALLEREGAVCAPVARQMAERARELFNADVAVSVTGIAGPNAPPELPVGLVYVGLATRDRVIAHEHRFDGDRERVRAQCVETMMRLVIEAASAEGGGT